MGNSFGSYPTTPSFTMAAYDRLPPPVREALRNASFKLACEPLVLSLVFCASRGRLVFVEMTDFEMADYVRQRDAELVAEHALKTYGPDHPQAVRPARKQARRKIR